LYEEFAMLRQLRRRLSRRQRSRRLRIESLEGRNLLAVESLIVNTPNDIDDGQCDAAHCSLREAINQANSSPSQTIISFNIDGDCPQVIQPTSALPLITAPVVIDGYSQPGAFANNLPIELGTNAKICIELNGGLIKDGSSGLVISGGSSTVRGLSITGFGWLARRHPCRWRRVVGSWWQRHRGELHRC
jgi:CSLREA domain-containing protein